MARSGKKYTIKKDGSINGIEDCVDILDSFIKEHDSAVKDKKLSTFIWECRNNFPHGIWFRGEAAGYDKQLTPSVFRYRPNRPKGTPKYFLESSMFEYARHRLHDLQNDSDIFTSLCTMQHYGLPTRLLDWTESIIVALFFATKYTNTKYGAWLFALNARKLNRITGFYPYVANIHDSGSWGTKFRCEFVLSNCRDDWYRAIGKYTNANVNKFDWKHDDMKKFHHWKATWDKTNVPIEALKFCFKPVAVVPSLNNPRMASQHSVFTLHGGKIYNTNHSDTPNTKDRIHRPENLLEINNKTTKEERFLKCYHIPYSATSRILRHLKAFGLHEGTVFPELHWQFQIIKETF